MNTDRIKEIQQETAYPESVSVQQALLKVWNECEQDKVVNKNDLLPDVSNRRELFDKFYAWLDGLSQSEYDEMSLTDKCEKFFFKT